VGDDLTILQTSTLQEANARTVVREHNWMTSSPGYAGVNSFE
jgi:hypothetical protein